MNEESYSGKLFIFTCRKYNSCASDNYHARKCNVYKQVNKKVLTSDAHTS